MKYVVGFLFNAELDRVVLIRKARPDWQAGKLNGVGGKVEPEETSQDAMMREFWEEAGLLVDPDEWHEFCRLTSQGNEISFFYGVGDYLNVRTKTDEPIGIYNVSDLMGYEDMMPNLRWLVQMARSFTYGERAESFNISEVDHGSANQAT
jgi:8-oxo-dGTP diphosphatase